MLWSNNQIHGYIKPVLGENSDQIIFHIGTNDPPFGKGNKDMPEVNSNLTMSVKTQSWGASISGITVRKNDNQNKFQDISGKLIDLCKAKTINFINHSKSIKPQHLKN